MKKNVLILSALCFATMTLVFSGCKKETNDPQEPAKVQTYQMSIQASKGADNQANGPRRVISLGDGGETLDAAWRTGDKVYVYKGGTGLGYLTAESDGVNTQLNGTLTGAVSVEDELTLKYQPDPNYAAQDGTLEYISGHFDYATTTVTVSSVDGDNIYTDGTATFENQQAIVKFTLNDGSDAIDAKPLVIKVGANTYTITPASATSEMYVALPGFASQNITFTATVGSDTYKKTVTGKSLINGEFYQITVEMAMETPAPEGAISGKFSVSSTKQVYFAKGNLKYTQSTGKFEFMTNQYDMVETNNQNVGDDYANQNVISLFGWATSNINTPVDNTYYYPWETDNSSSGAAKYGSGITTANVNWSDNGNEFANYDWGKNMGDGWRTLTKAEWEYLFITRTVNGGTGNGKSFTKGQSVNGTLGVVLYPDNYTGATYTGSNWSTFEDAGCVFLPAAGIRGGTRVSTVGSRGNYWSSTSSSGTLVYGVYFYESGVNPADYDYRYNGISVRLVKNVE